MSSTEETLQVIKCKMGGPKGVGKTSLFQTYMTKKFPTPYDLMFLHHRSSPPLKSATIKGISWTVELYDTIDNYKNNRIIELKNAHVLLVCFSVVLPSSIENIKAEWIPQITYHCPETPYILVGTQIDLREDKRTIEKLAENNQKPITYKEGTKLAADLKAVKYLECSAKAQKGLQELMEKAVQIVQAAHSGEKKHGCFPC
ncbi:cell division control protein 42 homolog [Argiope bruennichi]|uniref:cell division control protein 42 homolog n=1 Tax=Argiope bruennichi TaxID=94029 RepID=UPI0024951CF8|nr:cell division control protein 42 homolog [Argiope bruennichi]